MSIFLPFFNALGPISNDGLLLNCISPRQNNVTILASSLASFPEFILKKDNTGEGKQFWEDITSELSNSQADTIPGFNSSDDSFLIVVNTNDEITKIECMLQTMAIFTGTLSVDVSYWKRDGTVVTIPGTTSDWETSGLKSITHATIIASEIELLPLPTDEFGELHRYVIYTFKGIDSVATPAQLMWLRKHNAENVQPTVDDVSQVLSESFSPSFTNSVLSISPPILDSRNILGFPTKIAKIYSRIWKSPIGVFTVKLIYFSEDGWKDFPETSIISLQSRLNSTSPLFTNGPQTPFDINVFEDFTDTIIPPDDWISSPMLLSTGETLDQYWLGWEFIEDSSDTTPVLMASFWSQSLHGPSVVGVTPLNQQEGYQNLVWTAQNLGVETSLLVSNTHTGKTSHVVLGENENFGKFVIDLLNEDGDEYLFQILSGDNLAGPMYGYIQLT